MSRYMIHYQSNGLLFQIAPAKFTVPSVSLIGSQIYVVGGITQDSIVESVRIYDLHAKVWACQTSVKFVGSCTHATSPDEMRSMRLFGTAEDRPTNTIMEYNPL